MKSIKTLLAAVALLSFQCAVFSAGVVTSADETTLRNELAGGGTVTFDCDGVIVLSSTIVIAANTILDASGHNMTISGNEAKRIFTVNTNVNFILKNLVLANGFDIGHGTSVFDEFSGTGGALCSTGTVQIIQCVFSNNIASGTNVAPDYYNGATAGSGGAIFNMGILFVGDSVFIKNRAVGTNTNAGLGSTGSGGAIYNGGMLSVSNSLFTGNSATGGDGTPNLGTTYAGDSYGGAIFSSNNATIFNCTFSSNSATGGRGPDGIPEVGALENGGVGGVASGGGIYNSALLSVFNTTFAQNSVLGGAGGNGNYTSQGGTGGYGGDANG